MNKEMKKETSDVTNSILAGPIASEDEVSPRNQPLILLQNDPFIRATVLRFNVNLLYFRGSDVYDFDLFDFVVNVLERAEVIAVISACGFPLPSELREEASTNRLVRKHKVREAIGGLWQNLETHCRFKSGLLALLREKLPQFQRRAQEASEGHGFRKRFAELAHLLGLAENEAAAWLLAFSKNLGLWSPFADVCHHLREPLFAAALNLAPWEVHPILCSLGRLRRLNCLDTDLEFVGFWQAFLSGASDEPLNSSFFDRCTKPTLPWTMHGKLAEQHGEVLKTLLNRQETERPINILLHGEPGAGKTAFAESLAAELGRDLYVVKQSEEVPLEKAQAGSSVAFRFSAVQICDAVAPPDRSLILIDEADDMLRGSDDASFWFPGLPSPKGGGKGMLNSVLDRLRTPCIWITNGSNSDLAASSRRRFDYSIRFDKLTRNRRRQVWENAVQRYDIREIIDAEMIRRLADRYPISAGGIDIVLRNCADVFKQGSLLKSDATALLDKLLARHCELMDADAETADLRVAADYSIEGLTVQGKLTPERIVQAAREFRRQQESPQSQQPDAPRMNILLFGPPGTGKTEFVKYLAQTLDCSALTRMGSDLLSMYVGGTEQNIRRAFREAEAERAILFIDEADGMFHSRHFAKQSWEVTQVNELLQAMERFNGILICATNSYDDLDPATIRRFTFKLEFDYLTEQGKLLFYQRMLAGLAEGDLSPSQQRRLTQIHRLAPGDFRTVRQGWYYRGAEKTSHDALLESLERESQAKQQGSCPPFGLHVQRGQI